MPYLIGKARNAAHRRDVWRPNFSLCNTTKVQSHCTWIKLCKSALCWFFFPCRHLNCTSWTCDKECNYCTEAQRVPPVDLLLPWSTGRRRRKLKCFFKASVKLQECTSHVSPSLRTYPLHLGLQCPYVLHISSQCTTPSLSQSNFDLGAI